MQEEDFAALYARLRGPVYRFAAYRTTAQDAEDVTAETFAALWRERAKLPANPLEHRAWVFGIARRQLANMQRRLGRQRRIGLAAKAALAVGVPIAEDDPALVVAGADHARWVHRALSPRDQELLQLVGWDGLSYTEIAALLGLSSTAVSTRVERARARVNALGRLSEHTETSKQGQGSPRAAGQRRSREESP